MWYVAFCCSGGTLHGHNSIIISRGLRYVPNFLSLETYCRDTPKIRAISARVYGRPVSGFTLLRNSSTIAGVNPLVPLISDSLVLGVLVGHTVLVNRISNTRGRFTVEIGRASWREGGS